jgi:hypothetical protein
MRFVAHEANASLMTRSESDAQDDSRSYVFLLALDDSRARAEHTFFSSFISAMGGILFVFQTCFAKALID